MSDKIRQIDHDKLRVQLLGPKCHPMADNFDDDADGSDSTD